MDKRKVTDEEMILASTEEIEKRGGKPTKIVMPKSTQKEICYRMLGLESGDYIEQKKIDLINKNGLITLFGLEVESREGGILVEYE